MSVNLLLREVLDQVKVPDSIRVTTELEESLPAIQADKRQLTQVFHNIVLNAVQAMPDGGHLRIGAGSNGNGEVNIAIMDTGKGILPEDMDMLFEPLFTGRPRGIGLGLTLSKNLVESHQGRIEVESEPGKGSTFTVTLPVDEEGEQYDDGKYKNDGSGS